MAEVPEVVVKWSGKEYTISGLVESDTILQFKEAIYKETNVHPVRQKLLGLKYKGKVPDDEVQLSQLKFKARMKIMMMGSPEDVIADMKAPDDLPDVVNDFDIEEEEIAIENREEYLARIEKRIKDYEIKIITEPRPNKKLLVLDVDYTLFDHKSVAETGAELMRPYLHEFLTAAYEDYDIVIWSATGMKWIVAKMEELGVSTNTAYKICFMLDSSAMITVHTPKYGVIEVKPLGVLWGMYPQWSQTNTIMFDDVRRNFIMNPQTGLKIRPFKKAHFNRDTDRELVKLSKYLKKISTLDDFTTLDHKKWERYKGPEKRSNDTGGG